MATQIVSGATEQCHQRTAQVRNPRRAKPIRPPNSGRDCVKTRAISRCWVLASRRASRISSSIARNRTGGRRPAWRSASSACSANRRSPTRWNSSGRRSSTAIRRRCSGTGWGGGATPDAAIDGWRINAAPEGKQALMNSFSEIGFRFGSLASGAVALSLGQHLGWRGMGIRRRAGRLPAVLHRQRADRIAGGAAGLVGLETRAFDRRAGTVAGHGA